jgi:hypothetical protein
MLDWDTLDPSGAEVEIAFAASGRHSHPRSRPVLRQLHHWFSQDQQLALASALTHSEDSRWLGSVPYSADGTDALPACLG